MKQVTIHAAKTHLSKLIQMACRGEDIVIARKDKPVVKLVPIESGPRPMKIERKFGALKGKIKLDETFFDPLPEDELALWEK
ncbi:MAG: type II toxin-antitoxin system prevent-host-death family antitoxin [Rhodospirillaceae bacterium]|nr:type II toxin-antitoxin system prevent-host-death family antitoxin [Rhodospirillaceae bacterium]